ncbi:MAG TPA: hypothetical protein VNK51_06965 [Bradyrhizobium sp.]|nr:hypothetical protein [Bradyrhizobium sp.]
MTMKTTALGKPQDKVSRNLARSKPSIDEERPTQQVIVEEADNGRDLAHGEGGSIGLPTQSGDLAKDD